MSDFIVSARKYRPSTFDAVVGQSSITSTLKNAIKSNQLAQSFLFCGPRGVGKTSCARILAKTINCENITDNVEACNTCVSCKSFNENASFNVHELDAASNNSVDDIRKLVDQVRFAPQVGDYNIYIIDEVHMLSAQAFNAFLKTLEEPPKHAKFILATTEKHKIIPTILSRCQIFDFKRVGITDISNHLAFVAKSEGIEAQQEALHLIAQKSDGAMRDSLSMFDRLVSFSDKKLTYQGVIEHLNILDYDYYFKVTDALLKNDINALLNLFNEILDNGFDGHHFINGLAEHLRDVLVSKDESTLKLLEKGEALQNRYLEQSKVCSLAFLIPALDLCNECDVQYKTSNNKRLLVELSLMRISSIGHQIAEKKSPKSFIVTLNDDKKHVSVEKVT
jgi:DNA polymerase-3 subunit gamma/tau